VLSDLAYAEVYFDNNPPPSLLQVPGANDVAVEFTSMSKTFSMPGWRIGFAVGNERVIAALGRVNIISGLRRIYARSSGGNRCAQRSG
jgi:alanine-synthesizing transaminase